MQSENPFSNLALAEVFESLLPDFVLAFAFFTSLSYAILGRRFGRQRPAATMSVALGGALAIGLVWAEYDKGWSVRDLGPLAVGLAVVMLGMVMYQAVRQAGGSWAGAGIGLGASLLVATILGLKPPVASEIFQTATGIALTLGILAFLFHVRGHGFGLSSSSSGASKGEIDGIDHDMRDLYQDYGVGKRVTQGLDSLRREGGVLYSRPQESRDALLQIRRLLPPEGWLTERMAELRAKAHRMRKGHVARIEELRHEMKKLPKDARKRAAVELAERYREVKLDKQLEGLDQQVAEKERQIRALTREAEAALMRRDYMRLTELLEAAQKLQKRNGRLIVYIEKTEAKLGKIAKRVAREVAPGVGHGS
jgi:hypothetical protein